MFAHISSNSNGSSLHIRSFFSSSDYFPLCFFLAINSTLIARLPSSLSRVSELSCTHSLNQQTLNDDTLQMLLKLYKLNYAWIFPFELFLELLLFEFSNYSNFYSNSKFFTRKNWNFYLKWQDESWKYEQYLSKSRTSRSSGLLSILCVYSMSSHCSLNHWKYFSKYCFDIMSSFSLFIYLISLVLYYRHYSRQ